MKIKHNLPCVVEILMSAKNSKGRRRRKTARNSDCCRSLIALLYDKER